MALPSLKYGSAPSRCFEHRLRESRIGILTVLIGRIVGKQHSICFGLSELVLSKASLFTSLSLQHTDLFGVGHLHEGIRNVPCRLLEISTTFIPSSWASRSAATIRSADCA